MEQTTELTIVTELDQVVSISKVEQSVAQKHAAAFAPFMVKIHELSKDLATINKENPTEEDSKLARANRLAMVKNRTGSEALKKERKASLLTEGKLIDSLNGVIEHTSQLTEAEYEKIEKFAEIREKERKDKIRAERIELLLPYTDNAGIYPLADMAQDAFDQLLAGMKLADDAKKESERKAKEAQAEKERVDKLSAERRNEVISMWDFVPVEYKEVNHGEMTSEAWALVVDATRLNKKTHEEKQEAIRKENERLKKEKEEADAKAAAEAKIREKRNTELRSNPVYMGFIGDYSKLLALPEEEYQKDFSVIKAAAQAKADRDAAEERRKAKEKAEADAKLAAEKKEKEKALAELKAKQDAEAKAKAAAEKAEKDRIAAEKKAAKAPDKEKLNALATTIGTVIYPELKSEDAKKILENVEVLMDKVVAYIKEKAAEL